VLLRADSAFYGRDIIGATTRAGVQVSVTVKQDVRVKAVIGGIAEDAWTPIAYRDAVSDQSSGRWVSRAEVAEIAYVAFGRCHVVCVNTPMEVSTDDGCCGIRTWDAGGVRTGV
jgi:hypothetical protein